MPLFQTKRESDIRFWLRWVLANTLGELIGLSAVLFLGFSLLGPRLAGLSGAWPALVGLVTGILLGIFEGLVVGGAQGAVLRTRLPRLALRIWILATIIGAMIAWGLGMLPSTLINADAGARQAAPEMPDWLIYLLAAGMGVVAGIMLALPQWVVLRSLARRAGLWLPANALAWFFGMPLVFFGMGAIPPGGSLMQAAPIVMIATAAAGAMVGAVHGLFLIRILKATDLAEPLNAARYHEMQNA